MTSLRNKIMTSYGLSKVALVIFVAIVIADLHYLRTQIIEGEAIHRFYSVIQDMRRDEKNLFLYHEQNESTQLLKYLEQAIEIKTRGQRAFSGIASTRESGDIDRLLERYQNLIKQYVTLPVPARIDKQSHIRATGHALSELTRNFYRRERDVLAESTSVAVWTLMAASITVILLGVVSAMYMVRRIVKPLGDLENQLDAVADGNQQDLTFISRDKEIESFVHHFNTMIDKLRQQQSQLRHHEKAAALGVLVSGVAHELNNPLSNISTSVQLLLEDDGTTREELKRQWLSHVDNETERARRIVRSLLDTVRQPKLHMQEISADRLVQLAVLLIHRQLQADIHLHIEDISEDLVWVDRERMQQVFINLIKNAVDAGAHNISVIGKATTWKESRPENSDYLVGEVDQISQANEVMQFYIDDDGPGITEENLALIFDPFFTTKSSGEGTGLGLYLVEEIISEHSGCMSVENLDKGGTRFSVWLPLAHIIEHDVEQDSELKQQTETTSPA